MVTSRTQTTETHCDTVWWSQVWHQYGGPGISQSHSAGRWEIPTRWTDALLALWQRTCSPKREELSCVTTWHFRVSTKFLDPRRRRRRSIQACAYIKCPKLTCRLSVTWCASRNQLRGAAASSQGTETRTKHFVSREVYFCLFVCLFL